MLPLSTVRGDELALNTQKSTIFAIEQHISLSSVKFLISPKSYIW